MVAELASHVSAQLQYILISNLTIKTLESTLKPKETEIQKSQIQSKGRELSSLSLNRREINLSNRMTVKEITKQVDIRQMKITVHRQEETPFLMKFPSKPKIYQELEL